MRQLLSHQMVPRLLKSIASYLVAFLQIIGFPDCEKCKAIQARHVEYMAAFIEPTLLHLTNNRFGLGTMGSQALEKCSDHHGTNENSVPRRQSLKPSA
jgi:hypothetical protein